MLLWKKHLSDPRQFSKLNSFLIVLEMLPQAESDPKFEEVVEESNMT